MRVMKSAALLLFASLALAQPQHIQWTLTAEPAAAAPGGTVLIKVAGKIESGWHLYSASSATGLPTSFKIGPESVVASTRTFQPPPKRAFDPNFNAESETYEGDVAFIAEVRLKNDAP